MTAGWHRRTAGGACLAAWLAAALSAAPAAAQETGMTAAGDGWAWRVSIYGWLPGIDSNVGTDRGDVDSGIDTSDVLEALDYFFMGAAEARRGRWSVIGDLLYADFGTDKNAPFGLLFDKAEVETRLSAFTGYVAYRVAETPRAALDLGAGFRWYALDIETTLTAGLLPEESYDLSDDWADALLMARGSLALGGGWFATGLVDAGGGFDGDSETWQALATVGYAFSDRWSAQAGYRWLSLDKDVGSRTVELDLSGPIAGVSLRF